MSLLMASQRPAWKAAWMLGGVSKGMVVMRMFFCRAQSARLRSISLASVAQKVAPSSWAAVVMFSRLCTSTPWPVKKCGTVMVSPSGCRGRWSAPWCGRAGRPRPIAGR